MKKFIWVIAILILGCSVDVFGQNQRQKKPQYNLPEVDDEVLVAFRKNKQNRKFQLEKNQLNASNPFYILTRLMLYLANVANVGSHDPEFETWANRKFKNKK